MTTVPVDHMDRPSNGLAIAALCVAIPGVLLGLIPILGLFAIIGGAVALVLGIIAIRQSSRRGRRGMSITATILAVVSIVMGIIGLAIVADAVNDIDNEFERIEREYDSLSQVDPMDDEQVQEEFDAYLRDIPD